LPQPAASRRSRSRSRRYLARQGCKSPCCGSLGACYSRIISHQVSFCNGLRRVTRWSGTRLRGSEREVSTASRLAKRDRQYSWSF
jgi:hypothetical protein